MDENLKQKISLALKVLFVLCLTVYFVSFSTDRPRILVLHSFDTGYAWTNDTDIGIRRILTQESLPVVYWQYMDTKNHPSLGYKQKAGILARRMIDRLQPHVIIAADDDAQQFAARFYVNRPDMSIVFCGVNGYPEEYGYDEAQNVTGILERLPLEAIRDAIPYLVPKNVNKIKIIHLGDTSVSVRRQDVFTLKFDWSPLFLIDSILVDTFEEWKEAVADISKRADCLLISNYRQLARSKDDATLVPPSEIIEWTYKNSESIVFGVNGFVVEDGADIAISMSPYEQGEVAAQMAMDIATGKKKANQIPIQRSQTFMVYMNARLKQNKYFNMPPIYEAFAKASNNFTHDKRPNALKNQSYD